MSLTINETVKEHYESFPYPSYPLFLFPNPDSIELLKNSFPESIDCNAPLKILIGGCGTFEPVLIASAFKNASITAVDFSEKSLKKLKRRLILYPKSLRSRIHVVQHDLEKPFSFEENSFDLIFLTGVLHHSEYPEKILRNLLNLLKKEGLLRVLVYANESRKPVWEIKEHFRKMGFDRFKNIFLIKSILPTVARCFFYFHPKLRPHRKIYLNYISGVNKTEFWDGFFHPYDPPKNFEFWSSLFFKEGFKVVGKQSHPDENLKLLLKKAELD